MNIETLLYAYLAICTSMIVFNCVCIFVFRRRDTSLRRRSTRLEEDVVRQIQRIRDGKDVEERHMALLQKKLVRTNSLLVFDETLDRLLGQSNEDVWSYLQQIRPIFTYLALENKYHSTMKVTYFAYVIKKYRIIEGRPVNVIIDIMMKLLQEPSLYCRENALQAIYSSWDCGCILHALQEVDRSGRFHHAKLLTDGLMSFGGDKQQLTETLWHAFDQFSVQMKVVILDYIRFSGSSLHDELLQLMADERQDDEIRFACIRYFGRNHYEPAFPLLISFVECSQERRWEYASIAAMSLAAYPGERTVEVLKKALNSSSWYVRFNASKSLDHFHLSYLELSDVMEGSDRYAREILQYQMDLKNALEGQEAALT